MLAKLTMFRHPFNVFINVKALVGSFNHYKAQVGAFSVIVFVDVRFQL